MPATIATERPHDVAEVAVRARSDPGAVEVLLLAGLAMLLTGTVVEALFGFWARAATAGDNQRYLAIVNGILHWDFTGVSVMHLWGLPYVVAAVSAISGVTSLHALVAISVAASLLSVWLAQRLWGGWVAAYFAVISFDWLMRSTLGGPEPLFVALLFGAFVTARRERWALAALFAALATTVRLLAIFALAAVALELLRLRRYRQLLAAMLVAGAIGAAYVLPMLATFGNPLANAAGYRGDWQGASPVTFPFLAIAQSFLREGWHARELLPGIFWLAVAAAAILAAIRNRGFREYVRTHPVESVTAGLYLLFLFSYNSVYARTDFPRFLVPILPVCLLAVHPWLPKRRALLWAGGAVCGVLAGAAATHGAWYAITYMVYLVRSAVRLN